MARNTCWRRFEDESNVIFTAVNNKCFLHLMKTRLSFIWHKIVFHCCKMFDRNVKCHEHLDGDVDVVDIAVVVEEGQASVCDRADIPNKVQTSCNVKYVGRMS